PSPPQSLAAGGHPGCRATRNRACHRSRRRTFTRWQSWRNVVPAVFSQREGVFMLLRLRVELPDRPGSLGQVARTLGIAGADIVSVVVLERSSGRAVDDFTVVWPASALVGRILVGL